MKTRQFGKSDLEVSTIGLGTWPMGGARYGQSDDRTSERTIVAAIDAGITCFDTAPSYGNGHAEELLGRMLKRQRDNVVLVTKGGLVWNERSEVLGQDGRASRLESGLDASLKRLQTDYVDLFLIHWPDKKLPAHETAEALAALLEAGKTRYIGVSNYTGDEFRELTDALGDIPLITNQVSYHLFDRRWARSCFDTCHQLGAGVIAYGSLAHGLLTGTMTNRTTFDETDWRASGVIFGQPLLIEENRDRNLLVVERLSGIAASAGMTLPQLALAWVLSEPTVTTSLVGARSPEETLEAVAAADLALDDEIPSQIDLAMTEAAGMMPVLTP